MHVVLQVPPVLTPQDGSTVSNSGASNDNTQQARAQEVVVNALASLHVNMATVHLLDNDLVQAEKCFYNQHQQRQQQQGSSKKC
jgi:hypothetical protein